MCPAVLSSSVFTLLPVKLCRFCLGLHETRRHEPVQQVTCFKTLDSSSISRHLVCDDTVWAASPRGCLWHHSRGCHGKQMPTRPTRQSHSSTDTYSPETRSRTRQTALKTARNCWQSREDVFLIPAPLALSLSSGVRELSGTIRALCDIFISFLKPTSPPQTPSDR